MAYNKPKTVAKSAKKSSYVAGCPVNDTRDGNFIPCRKCERTE